MSLLFDYGLLQALYGRLRLVNAYGSELLPLRVEGRAEYWDGTRWLLNTLDNTSQIAAGGMSINAGGVGSNLCFLNFPPPSSPGNGNCLAASPTTTVNKGIAWWAVFDKPTPLLGFADLTANAPSWLEGKWNGSATGYNQDPQARLRFGAARSPYIYMRERY